MEILVPSIKKIKKKKKKKNTKTRTVYIFTKGCGEGLKRNFRSPKRRLFLPKEGLFKASTDTACLSAAHTRKWQRCCTDISSEHSLRTCTQVRRNLRKSDVVYACKKKKTRPKWPFVSGIWLSAAEPWSPAPGPPTDDAHRLFLPKGIIS